MEPDISDLLDVIVDTEPVTYTSVRNSGDRVFENVTAWVHVEETAEAAPSGGVYTACNATILIDRAYPGEGEAVKPGDRVTLSDGTAYTVLSALPLKFNGPWKLRGRNLALAHDLRDTGTLSRPSTAQGAAGRPTLASYTAVAENVACRVQPEGGSAGDVMGRRTIPKRFTTYVGVQVDARAKDRFVAGGVTYTVVEVRNPERLDQLPQLVLELVA
jgi:hypothetical protein